MTPRIATTIISSIRVNPPCMNTGLRMLVAPDHPPPLLAGVGLVTHRMVPRPVRRVTSCIAPLSIADGDRNPRSICAKRFQP